MDFSYLFEPYDKLVAKADQAFLRTGEEFAESIKCKRHCSDCCHAVFGLFLIESVFLKRDFDQLDDAQRKAALERCGEADRALAVLEEKLKTFRDDPHMIAYSMAKARIRCPLLNDNHECILYPYRPITCRVYGIPTLIRGVPRVCGKAGFENGHAYPTFNLDEVHKELFDLSKELLAGAGEEDAERASLLISVSKVIKTPVKELVAEISGVSDISG